MLTAIYYPHISIQTEKVLKNALLLWDKIEYMVPDRYHRPSYATPELEEAAELIAEPLVPSEAIKKETHKQIVNLVEAGLPDWFYFPLKKRTPLYNIYPQKFLPETYEFLRNQRMARPSKKEDFAGFETPRFLGLAIMSILADNCAGTQKRTLTDELASYSMLSRYITAMHQGEYGNVSSDYERLVTLSLRTIDTNNIDLSRMIELRRDEEKQNGSFLRELRSNYREAIDTWATRMGTEARTEDDEREIERAFEADLSTDLNKLKESLKVGAREAFFSKDGIVSILALPGILVQPPVISLIGVGALINSVSNYNAKRRNALRTHVMSWLYVSKARFQPW